MQKNQFYFSTVLANLLTTKGAKISPLQRLVKNRSDLPSRHRGCLSQKGGAYPILTNPATEGILAVTTAEKYTPGLRIARFILRIWARPPPS